MFETINPATGKVLKTYQPMPASEVRACMEKAEENFVQWRKTPIAERSRLLKSLANEFRGEKDLLAKLMTEEMGKTHAEGVAEIEKCADTMDYFAENAPEFLKAEPAKVKGVEAEIRFEPMGLVFSIMPWNFPFWQFVRFAAPSLMIGNVILLKHATITAGCAAKIEELCLRVFPLQLVFNLPIDHEQAAEVIRSPLVKGVTFTGSTGGGKKIAQTAGEALKKTVLELGGSDAYIILKDADIAEAAKKCAAGRMINNGQSCVAAKRFIVVSEVFTQFVEALQAELTQFPVLPLAHTKFKTQLQEQVQKLAQAGGKLHHIHPEEKNGAYFPAMTLVFEKNVPAAHLEELFGPVAMVFKAANQEEAMRLANASPFGLGGGVFSKDIATAKKWAESEMQTGYVTVNETVRSDPRLPFGGVKDSGYGRELSVHGFREFCNIKTVVTSPSADTAPADLPNELNPKNKSKA